MDFEGTLKQIHLISKTKKRITMETGSSDLLLLLWTVLRSSGPKGRALSGGRNGSPEARSQPWWEGRVTGKVHEAKP